MTETTPEQQPAETRAVVRYVGADPVTLPESARALPGLLTEGALVSLEYAAAETLLERDPDRFVGVTGSELDELLKAAKLPRTGTADEKRQRLADAEAVRVADEAAASAAPVDLDKAETITDTTGQDA